MPSPPRPAAASPQSTAPPRVETPPAGRTRVVIENVQPSVDDGRYPAKRTVGEMVRVEADAFTDGHDAVAAALLWRAAGAAEWSECRMAPLVNDRWWAEFPVTEVGDYEFMIRGWVDRFASWRRDLHKRVAVGQDVRVDLLAGAGLIAEAAERAADPHEAEELRAAAEFLRRDDAAMEGRADRALSERVLTLVERHAERPFAAESDRILRVRVDRPLARFGAWYELFPRSASPDPSRPGTLRDVEARLPSIAAMGFDVLYLPPIHPIGREFRKGPNNSPSAAPGDPGSPWAIGAREGGHKAIHPDLGTFEDFDRLVGAARAHGMEIALDIAFQCAPDHPYVREHPEWFRKRPDGTIQYAENPPKKYQDIYPFDFECEAWRELWEELLSVVVFWAERGVRVFRVDNPHTKPFAFWEWLIRRVKARFPDAIFLSEAFTRPKVMYRLAKLGFTQSYTYFAWRNHGPELEQYFTELTTPPVVEFFRASAWPNTPDILTEHLQHGGRPAFTARLILAATLCASYGVYGPPFEQLVHRPAAPGSEEYLDSEKYQVRHWDWESPHSLRDLMARVNRIRRENPALHHDRTLRFHRTDNPAIVCYSKVSPGPGPADVIVAIVNTDPYRVQHGHVELDLGALGADWNSPYQMHDLLTGARYTWSGPRNYVRLDPDIPAHVFALRSHQRTEHDFTYYL